jgi:sortase B
MKHYYRTTAALLTAAVMLFSAVSCQKAEVKEESREETSVVSEPEPSKAEESSKPKESSVVKKQESRSPSDRYVDSTNSIRSDFSDLLAQNPDTVGWINMPNSIVDYPVMQSEKDAFLITQGEDPYYLCRDFYHNNILSGSIFLDYRSKLNAKNLILHGHSMANGSMFAHILDYNTFSVYENAPVLSFNTLNAQGKWKIISVGKTNMLDEHGPYFDYMRGDFASDYDFMEFVYQIRARSIIDCPVTVNEQDTLMTISTCAYDFDDFRMFIVARKVRDGEDAAVNVAKAKPAANPLYPDVWYWYRGGSKPEVTSFQDALNKGKIDWYDGTKKWSKKDDEELPKTLEKFKASTIKKLQTCYNPKDYSKENQDYIKMYVDAYEGFINEAKNSGRVNALWYLCKSVIDSVEKKT